MKKNNQKNFRLWVLAIAMTWMGLWGCSSAPEEQTSPRTTQDIRGDSDRFFQKMEQEEKKP